jgi:hypothetical protein
MNQSYVSSSLFSSKTKYPDVLEEVKGKSFEELISPPKNLNTAKKRFSLQRKLYKNLANDNITWEEAVLGIKSLPSFTAPLEFYQNLKIVKMPEDIVENAERKRIYALAILNHPVRINSLKKAKTKVYKKPSLAHSRVLDQAEVKNKLITFSDLASIQPDLMTDRLHRRKLLAQGPFLPTSLKKSKSVRIPMTTGSMITGNPEMIAVSAMCGVLTFTYKEGLCSVPEIQKEITTNAVELLYKALNDSLWAGRSDKKELLDFWLSQIGITTSTNIKDALKRVKLHLPLIKKGKLSSLAVRIYNPQVSKETVETVKVLRKEYGDILEIFAGQANSVEAAQELVDAGADAIGQGIAGGLRCTTSIVSGVAVSVLRDLWRMRGKVNAPIFVDSSVSYYWSLAYLLGASMLVKPSHFVGIESMGAKFPFTGGKNYYIPYNGEASSINKEHTGRLMKNGMPFAPEGVGGFSQIDLRLPTIPDQILDAIINFLIPPFVFQGTSSGRRFETIEDMHKESDLEFLWELSSESRKVRGAWGPTFHIR